MPSRRRGQVVLAALAASSLLVACGGSSATTAPAANATQAPPAATPAAVTPAPTPAPVATAAQGGTGSQYTGAGTALDKLTSYRFKVTVSGTGAGMAAASGMSGTVTMDGVVVLKPQKAMSITMTGVGGGETGGVPMKYTIIGDKAWMEIGGTAMAVPGGSTGGLEQTVDAFSPQTIFGSTYDQYLDGLQRVGEEQKNGVATIHLRADAKTLDQLATSFGAPSGTTGTWAMDLWVAKDGGYMVSALTKGSYQAEGSTADVLVSVDISGIDDPANAVVAPA